MIRWLGPLLLAACAGPIVNAEDWPHLRGPRYDGISQETGLANDWPAAGPPVLWSRDLGQGYSGIIVVGTRLYTQMQNRVGQYVICLDTATGAELWRYRCDWPWQAAGAWPGPYATPTWAEGAVFFAAPSGLVGCLDGETGRSRWTVNVTQKFGGQGTEFGYACTPLVEGGRVILPVGGVGASVVALDAATGATVWQAGDDPASYTPAFPITFHGQRLIVAYLRNALTLHDAATGRVLVRRVLSRHYDEHAAWPLYAEPDLFLSAPFRKGGELLRLERMGTDLTLRPGWSQPRFANDILSSVLVDGHVYGFDLHDIQARAHRPSKGEFKCLDWRTGRVAWTTERTGHASVLAADGKLILLNDRGTLLLARSTPEGYDELARTDLFGDEGLCWTPPTLSRGRLYVRNQSRLHCVHLGRPEELTAEQREQARTQPASRSWQIDWTALLSHEPEYPMEAPTRAELLTWYVWCVAGVFGSGVLVGGSWYGVCRWSRSSLAWPGAMWVAATTAFLIGLAGTTLFSRWHGTFVLTWPASMFVAFQATVGTIVWAEQQSDVRRARWRSRVMVLLFVLFCYGYYELCRAVGVFIAWGFLLGFLPAFPFAVWGARGQAFRQGLGFLVAFTVYFWTSGYLPELKSHWLAR